MVARRIGAVLLALALGGGLAACGDDGGGSDDAVDQVDRDNGDGDSGDSDGDSGDSDSDSGDDGDSGDPDVDFPDAVFGSEECAELFEAFAAFGSVLTGQGDLAFDELANGFEALADSAPEIADDLEVMAEAYRDAGDVFSGGAINFADPEVAAALESFGTPEFEEASENVSVFLTETCDPNAG